MGRPKREFVPTRPRSSDICGFHSIRGTRRTVPSYGHAKLAAAAIPADKALYQRQIDATDRQIDALVYALYGLTEEEIGVVEQAGRQ
jgi:hypothetical protein